MPDHSTPSAPTGSPTPSAAERQRRHRERRRAGVLVVTLELPPEIVDTLVAWGWLSADQAKNPRALAEVIEEMLDCKMRGTFREGPIVVTGTSS